MLVILNGAIFFRNIAEGNQFESVFRSNRAVYGAGIFFYNKANNNRFNSDFSSNVANSSGGAMVFHNTTNNNNFSGSFVGNSALGEKLGDVWNGNGGAITFSDVSSNCLFDCEFINNTAALNGGGMHYWKTTNNITFNSNFTNNDATYGGAIYFAADGTVINSNFTNNTAVEGGAICSDGNLTIINSKFEDNVAASGTNHVALKDNATLTLINVEPAQLRDLNVSNITYGEIVKISSSVFDVNNAPLNNGTVSVVINNKTYSADVSNGTVTLEIPDLDVGNYTVDVKYVGNELVAVSSVTFSVFKQNATITAKNKAYIINYGGKYSIILKDANGNVIAGKKVSFKLNGKKLGSVATNTKGVAKLKLTAKVLKVAKAGKKKLVIKFGDSNYNAVSKTVKIIINKEKTKIIAKNIKFKKAKKIKRYTVALKNSKGKAIKKVKVYLKVKGKIYKAKTNSKGKATFKITKLTKKGKFSAAISFKGDKYYKKSIKKSKIIIR